MNILPSNKRLIASQMIEELSTIQGIVAIALGGSFARGSASEDSDLDLSLYYSEIKPPLISDIRILAQKFDSTPQLIVTQLYEWGPWVNGGAWLNTTAGEVDWLYRNLDQVHRVLEDAKEGKFAWDFRQQPPYGFFSVTYLADLQQNVILYDPQNILTQAKQSVQIYPGKLKQSLIQEHLWSIEFSYFNAKKLLKRNCIYGIAGCINRIAAELTQVLFALNETYFATDKNALQVIDTFSLKPCHYEQRLSAILSYPGKDHALKETLRQLHAIIQETMQLANVFYTPKYLMD